MNLITARNADEMLPIAVQRLLSIGVERNTRNGKVLQMPGPTILKYERPLERAVYWAERNANPFFHIIESMWMLAGRKDVAGISDYAARIAQYSDDGVTFNGAYGNRWRRHFGMGNRIDQLDGVVDGLKANPDCRRQVVAMWDPEVDGVSRVSRDLPCNTHIYFSRDVRGSLDMTVCNRSNDLIWGALGANAVHFSFLQEYMALRIGCRVGSYHQFTNNLHGYLDTLDQVKPLASQTGMPSKYERWDFNNSKTPFTLPLFTDAFDASQFELDLFKLGRGGYGSLFFNGVVEPVEKAWKVYKEKGPEAGAVECGKILAEDWRIAATEWMLRCGAKRKLKAEDDGVNYEQNK